MDRIEIYNLVQAGVKKYFQLAEAKHFFNVSEKNLKSICIENGLFENPKNLKLTKGGKRPMIIAGKAIAIFSEMGFPKI